MTPRLRMQQRLQQPQLACRWELARGWLAGWGGCCPGDKAASSDADLPLPLHARLPAQERVALLESELRKSKRAEQKLTALLYRLRQDVAALQQEGQAGSKLFDQLTDVRSLEYEVDFLTNKCKVSCKPQGHGLCCCAVRGHTRTCAAPCQPQSHSAAGAAIAAMQKYERLLRQTADHGQAAKAGAAAAAGGGGSNMGAGKGGSRAAASSALVAKENVA